MPATDNEQFAFIKDRMKAYFGILASISEQWTPPGKNAANGHWPNKTIADTSLLATEQKPTILFSGDGQKLFNILSQFQTGVRQALTTPNAHASAWTNLPLFWDVLKDGLSVVVDVVVDIYNLFNKDKDKQKNAKDVLFKDIEQLVKKIEDNGLVEGGEHANGHISAAIRDRSNETIAALNQYFPAGGQSQFQSLADALRIVCQKLKDLKTDDHKPWLRPEWQVSYQTITKGASIGLSA